MKEILKMAFSSLLTFSSLLIFCVNLGILKIL